MLLQFRIFYRGCMDAKIDITGKMDFEAWNRFCLEHGGNIYQSPYFYHITRAAEGYIPHPLFALWEGKLVATALPVEVRIMPSIFNPVSNRLIFYGGVLWEPGEIGVQATVELFKYILQSREFPPYLFGEVRNYQPVDELVEPLERLNVVFTDYRNFIVELTEPLEVVWKRMRKERQRGIRKAEKYGFLFREAQHLAEVEQFYEILRELYRRKKIPLAHISLFTGKWEEYSREGVLKIFVVEHEGQIVGGRAMLLYNGIGYEWYTAARADYAPTHVNEWMVWQTFVFLKEHGFSAYDFCGAGKPDEKYGVGEFKKRFGGTEVRYGRFVFTPRPRLYKLVNALYSRVQKR